MPLRTHAPAGVALASHVTRMKQRPVPRGVRSQNAGVAKAVASQLVLEHPGAIGSKPWSLTYPLRIPDPDGEPQVP
jgi:hypothetical protein